MGPSGEATIVTDLSADSPAVLAVTAVIGRPITTIRPEPAFKLDQAPGTRFSAVRSWRNLILVADLDRQDATTVLVQRTLGAETLHELESGQRCHLLLTDVWARGQTVLVLAARGEGELARAIRAGGDVIYGAFEDQVTQQIETLLYVAGEEDGVRRHLKASYGWSLRIPVGYRVGEDSSERFVRFFMREGGARLLFVHWQDGVQILPPSAECLALRARLVGRYYDGDFVDTARTRSEPVQFLGRPAHKLVGVWQNDTYTIGGPFRTYCFLDAGRFVMIDLAVFEPLESKVGLLRQLEAIARTYSDHRGSERAP